MNATQMLAAVLALPDPDLMLATRIEDGPWDGAAYKASTVVRLIQKARADERERCAKVCETTAAGLEYAEEDADAMSAGAEACAREIRHTQSEEEPAAPANSRARFDAFRAALDALCIKHGIQLSVSQYDGLQVWPLLPGEDPVHSNGFENCIPDGEGPK